MVERISPKTKRIVKAKIKGKTHKQIAVTEYPQAKANSGVELVSRQLRTPKTAQYYDKELAKTLDHYGITKSQYFMNIGLAMTAEKQNNFTGELTPDVGSRLAGNKAAERFLFKEDDIDNVSPALNQALKDNDVDEIQLIRLLKDKTSKT